MVRAVGIAERSENADWRDFGLYCDAAWQPAWLAYTIDWPDFGLPSDPEAAARQIADAWQLATEGANVEVGCLGGLGRTGTVLACMATLAGVRRESAVSWVRRHYRREAVETLEQEAWVLWFAEWLDQQPKPIRARRAG
jgi:protein-tyrosine phosphatase